MPPIYLDNHATTKLDSKILEGLIDLLANHEGNASSVEHEHGLYAKHVVDDATEAIADYFKIQPRGVVYTSGATEAANIAILGVMRGNKFATPKLILSAVEHPCVRETCFALADEGLCAIEVVGVDQKGRLNMQELEEKAVGASLGCFMAAQNEIGNIYPIEQIGKILKKQNCLFFCDGTQIVGKHPFSIKKSNIDFFIFSGHKIHAMQGVGCLLINNFDVKIKPIFFGGGQQKGLRPGTYNVPGIFTLGASIKDLKINEKKYIAELKNKRDDLMKSLKEAVPNIVFNGDQENKLPHNIHFSIPGVDNQILLNHLKQHVSVSTGSACSSGLVQHSKILEAMGLSLELKQGAIRLSVNKVTTINNIDQVANVIVKFIK